MLSERLNILHGLKFVKPSSTSSGSHRDQKYYLVIIVYQIKNESQRVLHNNSQIISAKITHPIFVFCPKEVVWEDYFAPFPAEELTLSKNDDLESLFEYLSNENVCIKFSLKIL